jgi:hypothetical protein
MEGGLEVHHLDLQHIVGLSNSKFHPPLAAALELR